MNELATRLREKLTPSTPQGLDQPRAKLVVAAEFDARFAAFCLDAGARRLSCAALTSMPVSLLIFVLVLLGSTPALAHPGLHDHGLSWASIWAHAPLIVPATLVYIAGVVLFARRRRR